MSRFYTPWRRFPSPPILSAAVQTVRDRISPFRYSRHGVLRRRVGLIGFGCVCRVVRHSHSLDIFLESLEILAGLFKVWLVLSLGEAHVSMCGAKPHLSVIWAFGQSWQVPGLGLAPTRTERRQGTGLAPSGKVRKLARALASAFPCLPKRRKLAVVSFFLSLSTSIPAA